MNPSKTLLVTMTLLVGCAFFSSPVASAQDKVDYLFPKIPAYRTDGPPAPPKLVLKVSPPKVPANLNVYQVQPIKVDETSVQRLATAFGLQGKAQRLKDGKWEVVEAGESSNQKRSLQIYEASGGLSYMFDNLIFAPVDQQPKLPSEKAAHELAMRFLKEKGLLPHDALSEIQQVHFSKPTLIERNAKEKKTLREIVTGIEVRLPRVLDGYQVAGPGSKLYIAFGEGERILGVTRVWREVKKSDRTLPSIRPGDAIRLLQQGVGVLDADPACVRADVTRMELVYWMEGPKAEQRVSLPVYRIEGTCVSAESKVLGTFKAYAPAVLNKPFGG
jgi:hypothetical protein